MRFFEVLDLQHMVLAIFLGLVAALVLYIAFRRDDYRRQRPGPEEPETGQTGVPASFESGTKPMPLVLVFLYAGFIVWLIVYVIYFGLKRGPV